MIKHMHQTYKMICISWYACSWYKCIRHIRWYAFHDINASDIQIAHNSWTTTEPNKHVYVFETYYTFSFFFFFASRAFPPDGKKEVLRNLMTHSLTILMIYHQSMCSCSVITAIKRLPVIIWNRTTLRALVQNQHTRELISARKTSHKHNIDLSRLR